MHNPYRSSHSLLREAAWRDSIERRRRAEARLHLTFVAGAVIILLVLLYAFLYALCAGV